MVYGTVWSLLPPIIAILIALITKEVFSSLLCGILVGAFMIVGMHPWLAFTEVLKITAESININILIFDLLLGMVICLLGACGSAHTYGKWISKRIKNKKQSLVATTILGILVFVDDYFNCLTVGTVMHPVTDRYKVSRAKLAYIIDSTAAPICIIMPISSWAAAVNSYVPSGGKLNGFQLFISTIPFNFYAILTIYMVLFTSLKGIDYGMMKKYEETFSKDIDDSYICSKNEDIEEDDDKVHGRVIDFLLPIVVMIISAIVAMIYTGYINGARSLVEAFANCNAEIALICSMICTITICALLYLPRKIMSFKDFMKCLPKGAEMMISAIVILVLAWTLKGITDHLGIAEFVSNSFKDSISTSYVLASIFFVVSAFIAFSTGTSWGTFSILIPIVIAVFSNDGSRDMVITVSAVLAGAVCGDHISPISDTTIMASAGAGCNHIAHVRSQLEYAVPVIIVSALGYILTAFTKNWLLILLICISILSVILIAIQNRKINTNI